MKFFVIAGEASGDLHAANLMRSLSLEDKDASFVGLGGDKMRAAGCDIRVDYRDMAYMGVVAVLANLPKIRRNFRIARAALMETRPDVLILIDYPSFNLRMAAFCRKHLPHTRIVYYIPPKVWAWKSWRVHRIARYADDVLGIFPFEPAFYARYGYSCQYVGNPTADCIRTWQQSHQKETEDNNISHPTEEAKEETKTENSRTDNQPSVASQYYSPSLRGAGGAHTPTKEEEKDIQGGEHHSDSDLLSPSFGGVGEVSQSVEPLIALLPGSRPSEIRHCLPTMLEAARCVAGTDYRIVVAAAPGIDDSFYAPYLHGETLTRDTYTLVSSARAAVVNSGTATLETALLGCPQTAVYYIACSRWLEWLIRPILFRTKYFTLVNIIPQQEVIQELIASRFTVSNVEHELRRLLSDEHYRHTMLTRYRHLSHLLTSRTAARTAAHIICHNTHLAH